MKLEKNLFKLLCNSRQRFTGIRGQFFLSDGPPILTAIELEFDGTRLLLTAQGDDSIRMSPNENIHDEPEHEVQVINDLDPWKHAINKPMLWIWQLTNQQGYLDGLQLYFGETVQDDATIIQLLVAASGFKVYRVRDC